MKKSLLITLLFVMAGALLVRGEKVPRAYGIRVYSDAVTSDATLVSFPVDNPQDVSVELDVAEYNVRAAAFADGVYYMVGSADGMMASHFYAMDMASKKVRLVKEYDYKHDLGGLVIPLDMAYDKVSGKMYAIGFDLTDAEVVGDDVNAKFGLFTVDPATGEFTLVGTQSIIVFTAIAFDSYGSLLGIADNGNVWEINSRTGRPMDEWHSTDIVPAGLQGFTSDQATGKMYWASFSVVDATTQKADAKLVEISFDDEGYGHQTVLGQIKDNAEIIGLYVDPDPAGAGAPVAPGDLTVAAGASGALSAKLSWVNPSVTNGGTALSAVDIKIYRNGKCVKELPGRKPGEADTYTDEPAESGMAEYSVSGVNGGEEGSAVYAETLFVGADVPGKPQNPAAARTGTGYDIEVSWSAPATGAEGGWFDRDNVSYTVIRYPDRKLFSPGKETRFTDNTIADSHGYYYVIIPSTEAGEGESVNTPSCFSGPALKLPYVMNLDNNDDANMWSVFDVDKDGYKWYTDANWGGTTERFFRYYPADKQGLNESADDWLISAPMTLEAGKHYAVKYSARLMGAAFPVSYSLCMGEGANPEAMTVELEKRDNVSNDIVWEPRSVCFAADKSGDYSFGFHIGLANPMQLYKVEVREIAMCDMAAVSVSGPASGGIGNEAEYTVKVSNDGFNAVDSYTVYLVDDAGNVLASAQSAEALAAQQSAEIVVKWTPEKNGAYAVRARVEAEGDLVPSNDLSEPVTVLVLGSGEWRNVTDGKTMTAYSPFYVQYYNSTSQTIYTAEEVGARSSSIEALRYYYKVFSGNPLALHARIWLANVEQENYTKQEFVPKSEFTLVYEGDIRPEKTDKGELSFVFDTPFEYKGGNLCVMTEHSFAGNPTSSEVTSVMLVFDAFVGSASNNAPFRMVLYRDNDRAYDFASPANGMFRDRVNASFYLTGTTGVENVAAGSGEIEMTYTAATGLLQLSAEASVRVYSLQGSLIGSFGPATEFDLSDFDGFVIVEASNAATRSTCKLKL